MTDDQLELRLRDWYRAEVPADETAPAAPAREPDSDSHVPPARPRRFASAPRGHAARRRSAADRRDRGRSAPCRVER